MSFVQTNANPLNGKPTYYKREGALYKSLDGAFTRVLSQIEIDAFNYNPNAFEHYVVDARQLARLQGLDPDTVLYPAKPNGDVDITGGEADGISINVNGQVGVKTIIVRIGIAGKAGADMLLTTDGNLDNLKTIAGHTVKKGDVISMTYANFNGTYTVVDDALTSLEAWNWLTPYKLYTATA